MEVWLDEKLGGGETWWAAILSQIRMSGVFVFALSDNSLRSKPCRSELGYAQALGLPVLPVQIGEVASYRVDPIFTMQLVDYRQSSRRSGIELVSALLERAAEPTALPDPLPEPPSVPYEYLHSYGAAIRDPAELTSSMQRQIFFELHGALDEEDDPVVLDDIRRLLRELRRRKDVTHAIAREIDTVLDEHKTAPDVERHEPTSGDYSESPATLPSERTTEAIESTEPTSRRMAESESSAGWYSDPSGEPGYRYFDGRQWTTDRRPAASEPSHFAHAETTKPNKMAVWSLVSSLLGSPFWGIGSIVGIVLGKLALDQIGQSASSGRRIAFSGIAIGIVGLIIWLVILVAATTSR